MDKQLKEFFCDEVERRHLDFEAFPEYNDLMAQSLSLFPNRELPKEVFHLLEMANLISFAHGLKLGLRLRKWARL